MEKRRQIKILSIVALVVAIMGMSLGFAAFSTTLNISSSASVTPSSNDFKVVFSSSESYVAQGGEYMFVAGTNSNGATSMTASIGGTNLYDVDVSFTAPNQSVTYSFYIHNVGEYDAYLTEIYATDPTGNGTVIWCEPVDNSENGATEALVRDACEGIGVSIDFGEKTYSLGDFSIYSEKIEKGTSRLVELTISYKEGSALADGPFDVYIGDIFFNFSTVKNAGVISFSINGVIYESEEGMTWEEWVESNYNPYEADYDLLRWCSGGGYIYYFMGPACVALTDNSCVNSSDVIIDNYSYKSVKVD